MARRSGFLGVLMLQTRFVRPPGDIGHAATFDFPLRRIVVPGATPERIVRGNDAAALTPFVAAGRALVEEGAAAITTSCGFLALRQRELQAALPVPVWTSALLEIAALPERRCGVITIDAAALTPRHLAAVGADPATPVEGIAAGSALQRTLLEDRPDPIDAADAEAQVLAAGKRLVARCPHVDTLVLECTNLPPYADALRRESGRPVHDVVTMLNRRFAALSR